MYIINSTRRDNSPERLGVSIRSQFPGNGDRGMTLFCSHSCREEMFLTNDLVCFCSAMETFVCFGSLRERPFRAVRLFCLSVFSRFVGMGGCFALLLDMRVFLVMRVMQVSNLWFLLCLCCSLTVKLGSG